MFEHLLVVCTGNICRSPVAEAMLKVTFPERHVVSAGLGALVGQGVEPKARKLAEADGLQVEAHQARQITHEMIHDADLILVMSEGQRRSLGDLSPSALGKIMLIGRWLDGGKGVEIPDPYRKSDEAFEHVHGLLKEAIQTWRERL